MGSDNKEKWLGKLKDSVQNYSEQLPDSFWEELQKDIPVAVPPQRKRIGTKVLWPVAAAAIVLLALVLVLPKKEYDDALGQSAVTEQLAVARQQEPGDDTPVPVSDEPESNGAVNTGMEDNVPVPVVQEHQTPEQELIVPLAVTKENGIDVRENPVEEEVKVAAEEIGERKEEERKVGEKEKEEKKGRDKAGEREELLRELEYLQQDEPRKKNKLGKLLALSVGNSSGELPSLPFGFNRYGENLERVDDALGTLLPGIGNLGNGATDVSGGTSGTAPDNPGSVWGFINMDYKPVGNIVWIGETVPVNFKEEPPYKNYSYDHRTPVKLGVSFARELMRNLYVETGISYQYLKSSMENGNYDIEQKLHYLGVPLRLSVRFVGAGRFSLYASAGYLLEKCVYGEMSNKFGVDEKLSLKQWQSSLNAYVGVQLDIGGGAALYLEPGGYWYLGMDDSEELSRQKGYVIKSFYSENPKGISFQGGVRFTF